METDLYTPEQLRNMQRGLTANGHLVQQPSDEQQVLDDVRGQQVVDDVRGITDGSAQSERRLEIR